MRWRVHECCCGCRIRRGTFIIGVVNTVTVIYVLVDLCLGGPIYKSTIPPIDDGYNIPQEKTFRNLLRLGYIGSLVVNGLVILCSVLLIAGAVIEFPLLLLPWAVFSSLLLVLVAVDGIYCSVYFTIYYSVIFGVLTTFCLILGLMVWIHFILVVCSYYKTLLEARKHRSKEEMKEKPVV
ncbi:uncharacterized protein [Anabrus simplex]|uniref:uncharacterized protein n=1 Tax=Anabrus simplex TaxID=316456 RepID=UPI0035A3806B